MRHAKPWRIDSRDQRLGGERLALEARQNLAGIEQQIVSDPESLILMLEARRETENHTSILGLTERFDVPDQNPLIATVEHDGIPLPDRQSALGVTATLYFF